MVTGEDTVALGRNIFLQRFVSDTFFALHCQAKPSVGKVPIDCNILQGKLCNSNQNLDSGEGTNEILKIM